MTHYGTCSICKRALYARRPCCQEALLEPLLKALDDIIALDLGKTPQGKDDFYTGPDRFFRAHEIARNTLTDWRKRYGPTHKPAPSEVKDEIAALQAIKPRVLRGNMFGDDHHAAIDAQVLVLEVDLSAENIDLNARDDPEGWPDNVRDAAQDARRWLDGEYEDYDSLVDSWKELAKR